MATEKEKVVEATPRPWKISGATVIWSPTGRANVAAVSDPRPPNNSSVGYFEIRAWDASDNADERFREACANAELIISAVNERSALQERVKQLEAALLLHVDTVDDKSIHSKTCARVRGGMCTTPSRCLMVSELLKDRAALTERESED